MTAKGGENPPKRHPKKRAPSPAGKISPQRRSLSREIAEEPDPAWRVWFEEVQRRKKKLTDPKNKAFVRTTFEKDGIPASIARKKSEPIALGRLMKRDHRISGTGSAMDIQLALVQAAWRQAVGADLAGASDIYSFKNGILTISIFSSSLLQEIRQFHQEAILGDLRDIWRVSTPLVKILYRLGKR